jgi:hypothetical protein
MGYPLAFDAFIGQAGGRKLVSTWAMISAEKDVEDREKAAEVLVVMLR